MLWCLSQAIPEETKMGDIHKRHPVSLKIRVAAEAVAGHRTVPQIASEYGVHSSLVRLWKKTMLEKGGIIYSPNTTKNPNNKYSDAEYEQIIGEISVENNFLKKKLRL
jgi:transposase-like protein